MSHGSEGRENWVGRPRGGINRGGGRGFGGPGGGRGQGFQAFSGGRRVVSNIGEVRDPEEHLLIVVNSEFQVNTTNERKLVSIYEHVRQFPNLFNYIHGNIEELRTFIIAYKDNFLILPDNETVKWLDRRVVSQYDRKENRRKENREHAMHCLDSPYDLVLEENVLSFITALFSVTGETWLPLDSLENAMIKAFHFEADLRDYVGRIFKRFLVIRDHMFMEFQDEIRFFGQNAYSVVYYMNNVIRECYKGGCRETVRRLHEFYLQEFSADVRRELEMDNFILFCDFLSRCTFVFDYKMNDTHISSKKIIPYLSFKRERLSKEFADVVEKFKQNYEKEKTVDKYLAAYDTDDLDAVFESEIGNRKRQPASDRASSVGIVSDNPFLRRRAAATTSGPPAGQNFGEWASSADIRDDSAAIRPPKPLNPFLRTPGMPGP